MLRITSATDLIKVNNIILTIYAGPGLGKTSLAFTAANVLLFDFDRGAHRSAFRKDAVQVGSWADVQNIADADLADYETIALDTVGRMLDTLAPVVAADDKRNVQRSGQLTLQGYGALKQGAANFLERIRAAGKDIVLLSHMDEQIKGDDVRERLDISGGTKNEIHKLSDAMARLNIVDGKRMLSFSPSDTAYGKNPAGFAPVLVPSFDKEPLFLAGLIAQIKAKLNAQSAEAALIHNEMDTWRVKFFAIDNAGDFKSMTLLIGEQPDRVKHLLMQVAKAKGFRWDKDSHTFVPVEKAA